MTFSRNWEIRLCAYQRSQENFYLQPVELWKTPSREKKISEHDITQHTKITTEIRFFLCLL